MMLSIKSLHRTRSFLSKSLKYFSKKYFKNVLTKDIWDVIIVLEIERREIIKKEAD